MNAIEAIRLPADAAGTGAEREGSLGGAGIFGAGACWGDA